MKKGWYWPAILGGLMAIVLVPNFVLVYLATSDPSFAVEEDYYGKALAWDETMAQESANAALGWIVAFSVGPSTGGSGLTEIRAEIREPDGREIGDAAVRVTTFHNARASRLLQASLEPDGDGGYSAELPLRRPGLWEFRFEILRGDDRFTHTAIREVGRRP